MSIHDFYSKLDEQKKLFDNKDAWNMNIFKYEHLECFVLMKNFSS